MLPDKILPRKETPGVRGRLPGRLTYREIVSGRAGPAASREELEEKTRNMCDRHIFEYNLGVFVCENKIKRNNFILLYKKP
ncbi:MAG: hypothetical protein ACI4W2_02390 [Eubacterium sp.]